jgi:hypothetical protein
VGKWQANLLKRLKSFQSFENSRIFKSISNGLDLAGLPGLSIAVFIPVNGINLPARKMFPPQIQSAIARIQRDDTGRKKTACRSTRFNDFRAA